MAEKVPPQGVFYYNAKGQNRHCTNEADIVNAKRDGYTSSRYVRSNWPTTAFNKNTGETKPVGRVDLTEEQNQALLKALGDEWGLDYVAAKDPEPKKDPDHKAAGHLEELVALLVAQKNDHEDTNKRLEDLEAALVDSQAARVSLEARISELEGQLK